MKSVQNGISLKMTIKTRWGSFLKCLKSLLESKYALKYLAVHEETSKTLRRHSTSCILDEDIVWLQILKIHDLLNLVVKWIKTLKSYKQSTWLLRHCLKSTKSFIISTTLKE